MSAPILSIKLREVRRSKSRKVNAYVAACVTVDYRAAGLRKRLQALTRMKARYQAVLVGREAKRQKLTAGQMAEAGRLLKEAGFAAAGIEPMLTWDISLPAKTYFGGDGNA